jgi:two-component system chemotaxis response regulator CheB
VATTVLIVDDSSFFRKILTELFESDPTIKVIGTAANGQEGVKLAQELKPDVITMDFEMPVMNGVTAVRQIMQTAPTSILMLSTWTTEGAKSTLEALEAGALDYMPKRFDEISADKAQVKQKLCQRVRHLASSFHITKPSLTPRVETPSVAPAQTHKRSTSQVKLVAIATSTGGPVALQHILTKLPANFPYPILLVQHMPANFTPSFAERLNQLCAISIKQAETGDRLKPGHAYLAPGGKQMVVTGRANNLSISVEDAKTPQTYKPCVDITFESIAKICPEQTLAVVLTGMGSDGRDGSVTLHKKGGIVWAQDEASSTIYGMPMAVAKAGVADKILSLDDIGSQLAELR